MINLSVSQSVWSSPSKKTLSLTHCGSLRKVLTDQCPGIPWGHSVVFVYPLEIVLCSKCSHSGQRPSLPPTHPILVKPWSDRDSGRRNFGKHVGCGCQSYKFWQEKPYWESLMHWYRNNEGNIHPISPNVCFSIVNPHVQPQSPGWNYRSVPSTYQAHCANQHCLSPLQIYWATRSTLWTPLSPHPSAEQLCCTQTCLRQLCLLLFHNLIKYNVSDKIELQKESNLKFSCKLKW